MTPSGGKRRQQGPKLSLGKKRAKRTVRIPPNEPNEQLNEQLNEQPSTHLDVQAPSDALWLDALPTEICVRIAAHVSRSYEPSFETFLNPTALALAASSSKQRRVMEDALDHTPDLSQEDTKRLLDVFDNPFCIDARNGRGNTVLHLLSRSSLRAAHIANRGNHFTAISTGNSVVELSIHFERITSARYTSMLEALQKLSTLVSLSLFCYPAPTCLFETVIDDEKQYARLAKACPRLSALHMHCHCYTAFGDQSPVAVAFPNLKEITVSQLTDEAAVLYLRTRESVSVASTNDAACRYAADIGSAVTSILFPEPDEKHRSLSLELEWMRRFSEEDVVLLKSCPRLRELDLQLLPGAEMKLPELKELVSLRLYWGCDILPEEEVPVWDHPLDSSLVRRLYARPMLRRLALVGAPVLMADLIEVLRVTGDSLVEMAISLEDQPDIATDRLLALVQTVLRYNGKLRTLENQNMENHREGSSQCSETEKRVSRLSGDEKKEFASKFRSCVVSLRRKNPWFDVPSFLRSADNILDLIDDMLYSDIFHWTVQSHG